MTKVLYIVYDLHIGGIKCFTLNLLQNLDRNRFNVDLLIASEYSFQEEKELKELGVNIIKVCSIDSKKKKYQYLRELTKVIKEGKYDVIHTHMGQMNYMNLLVGKIFRVPKRISHCHIACNHTVHSNKINKFKDTILQIILNYVSTHRLGCSLEANKFLYGERNLELTNVVTNGIDIEEYRFPINECFEKDINVPSDKKIFVHVGRMCALKNSLFLIDIIHELYKIRQDIHLLYVGDGELKDKIKDKIDNYGLKEVITLLGDRKDVPSILQLSDYFLFPSIKEGLGIALIEAQANNKFCFISDTVPLEADLGLCLRISLEADCKKWANIIDNCITNSIHNHYKINDFLLDKFSIKYTVTQMEEIYGE